MEIVLKISLLKKGLNGEEIANLTTYILEVEFDFVLPSWRATMLDRATTNGKACKLIKNKCHTTFKRVPCIPHGLSRVGKKIICEEGDIVTKQKNKIVQYPTCHSRLLYREMFGESALTTGGVHWYIKSESMSQTEKNWCEYRVKNIF